ncbi:MULTISPECIES: Dabb family protein [unclassified Imperialibacter]|uniref:Dabb family protein n=1 Tax=unclassified Imperialibacter TaxID=2629706 RepID=UPI001251DEE9|nr:MULTISPECIES: Dabb family protein [unclassified Imperialibacter]CAD5254521.1 Stress responsive A/B Barrel Domain [Imperialibacter sp. 89]CAD5267406.1 Stress responsive A/B Barrel Domain [Imperialibacter sp. 75]VVT00970.1 Stress responsive A/B Barrel Domain [Imperialibacter sp. EC-SDR9]
MKNLLICFAVAFVAIAFTSSNTMAQGKGNSLRHVVLFKFKDTSSAEDVKKVVEAFEELPKKIKQIKAFEWGTNNSPEGLNQGLTHAFILTFNSEKDRDDYLVHPDHKVFGGIVGPHLDGVTVVDFWVEK